jgi:nitrogenase molybdenum-cofactor synthesis protein NifE
MKQVYTKLCTYSADLFGINSALYELGGLIVMHDASGCNSTYNTHDEPRWYTMDSMVYVSGLVEQDAILGNDERLIQDIVNVAETEHPKFIALSRSVLPTYLGTDVRGIARVVEKRTGIPTFGFATNGMDSYVCGASAAYREIARRFCREHGNGGRAIQRHGINLLGVTPLDFSITGNAEALSAAVKDTGFDVRSCWSMHCTLEELAEASEAEATVVVSTTGLAAAEYLEEKFSVPYVIGIPCGPQAMREFRSQLKEAARTGLSGSLFSGPVPEEKCGDRTILVVGEAVHAASIRFYLEKEYGYTRVRVLCPLEKDAGVLRPKDLHCNSEEEISAVINASDVVIADPIYRRVVERDLLFLDDPHEAYSGRIFHDRQRMYVGRMAEPFAELRP